jgi:hypothetical protein
MMVMSLFIGPPFDEVGANLSEIDCELLQRSKAVPYTIPLSAAIYGGLDSAFMPPSELRNIPRLARLREELTSPLRTESTKAYSYT